MLQHPPAVMVCSGMAEVPRIIATWVNLLRENAVGGGRLEG